MIVDDPRPLLTGQISFAPLGPRIDGVPLYGGSDIAMLRAEIATLQRRVMELEARLSERSDAPR